MIPRLLRRWVGEPTPEDGLAETLEITIRCARRCAYDLSHAADMIPSDISHLYGPWRKRMQSKADYWQSLFSSGASMKDYRLRLHRDLDERDHKIERLRSELIALGHSGWLENEVPF